MAVTNAFRDSLRKMPQEQLRQSLLSLASDLRSGTQLLDDPRLRSQDRILQRIALDAEIYLAAAAELESRRS